MVHIQENLISSLLFYAVGYLIISFQFRRSRKSYGIAVALLAGIFSVKFAYDISTLPVNHYEVMEVGRHSNTLDIRRSYKRLSKIYHPDKNLDGTEDIFQRVKQSYDILMDEERRDVYNRFGSENFDFDPRKDEIRLISDVAVIYLFLGISAFVMTLPHGARASRTWITLLTIAVLAVDVTFKLTDTIMPEWMPESLTEFELVFYLHSFFPFMVALLRVLAETLHVDADLTALLVLKEVHIQQKGIVELLNQLQSLVETDLSKLNMVKDGAEDDAQQISLIQNKLSGVREQLELAGDNTTQFIEDLRQCAANPGSQYYFLIFVALYGGIYFLQ